MITNGENIERAEHLVRVLFESGTWPDNALEHFDIEMEGFKNFIEGGVMMLRKMYGDIDPRHEAAIATLMTHVFFTGFACGRIEGYSEDSGLNV